MDIAKIRKKIKDAGGGPPGEQGNRQNEPVAQSPQQDLPGSEPAAQDSVSAVSGSSFPSGDIKEDEVKGMPEGALPERTDELKAPMVELLTFSLSNEEYAIRVEEMREIVRFHKMTALPEAEPSLTGIVSLRGKIVPVLDLSMRLSLSKKKAQTDGVKKRHLLVIRGSKGPIGIIVDRVILVLRVQASEVLAPPSHLSDSEVRFIEGVVVSGGRFISILNVREVTALDLKT